jgi:hypothetical protein
VFFIASALAAQQGETNAVPLGLHVSDPWPR